MDLENIWLVVGSTGEYSDFTEWFVAAYTNKEQASLANKMCAGLRHTNEIPPPGNLYDPGCMIV